MRAHDSKVDHFHEVQQLPASEQLFCDEKAGENRGIREGVSP